MYISFRLTQLFNHTGGHIQTLTHLHPFHNRVFYTWKGGRRAGPQMRFRPFLFGPPVQFFNSLKSNSGSQSKTFFDHFHHGDGDDVDFFTAILG
jgi:hypothetical protein